MISKKITYLLKISLMIIGIIGASIGTMYLLGKMICRKKIDGECVSHCCSNKHKHNEHEKCHTH